MDSQGSLIQSKDFLTPRHSTLGVDDFDDKQARTSNAAKRGGFLNLFQSVEVSFFKKASADAKSGNTSPDP